MANLTPSNPPYLLLWLLVFAAAAALAGLVQLAILPHILPALDGGHGLLIATDSLEYHREAALLAERIWQYGWQEWSLLPKGHVMIGLPAAIYAVTIGEPWVLIPLSAAAHAFCVLIFMRTMMLFTADWRLAALATLPFAAFPSAMQWYTQLLKDGYFLLGLLLFAFGWMRIATVDTWRSGFSQQIISFVSIAFGFVIMAIVRVYSLNLMLFVAVILLIVAALFLGLAMRRSELTGRQYATAVIVAVAAVAALWGIRDSFVSAEIVSADATSVQDRVDSGTGSWKSDESFLPAAVQRPFLTLSGICRAYLRGTHGASSIDFDRKLESVPEILGYLPRALQIGYLAPFPDQWFGEGSTGATTIMRRVSMLEMIIVYSALAFLPLAIWRWRRSGPFWVLLALSVSLTLVFTVATPNVGTLYRVRYGFLMPVVGVGLLAAAEFYCARRKQRHRGTGTPTQAG